MSDGQVKKPQCQVFLELFGNRTSKNLGVVVHRTSDHFKKFLPLKAKDIVMISAHQSLDGWMVG